MKGHKTAMAHMTKALHHVKKSHEALGSMKHEESAEKFEKKYRGKTKKK